MRKRRLDQNEPWLHQPAHESDVLLDHQTALDLACQAVCRSSASRQDEKAGHVSVEAVDRAQLPQGASVLRRQERGHAVEAVLPCRMNWNCRRLVYNHH